VGQHQSQYGKTGCAACAPGHFADVKGLVTCKKCSAGQYQTQEEQTECINCAVGHFQSAKGQSSCTACDTGYVQPAKGKAACNICDATTYAPTVGLTVCTDCEVGKFQAQQGQASCTACLVGHFNADKKQTACKKCAEGRYQNARQATSCIKCAKGRFGAPNALGESVASYCQHCPHGKYNPTLSSTTCIGCLAGKAGQHGAHGATSESDHCTTCAAGRFMLSGASTHVHRAHSCDKATGECDRNAAGVFAECHACPRLDDRRYQWSEAGALTCQDVSVDCKPSPWGSWSTCTKSCTPMTGDAMTVKGTPGAQYRTRAPQPLLPCKLGDAAAVAKYEAATGTKVPTTRCDMAWGVGRACSAFPLWVGDTNVQGGQYFKDEDQCNHHECPVDCVPHSWGAWSACSATCDIGTTTRTRNIKVANAYGGVACTNGKFPLLHTQKVKCNEEVSCSKWALPKCQTNHVHCDIKKHNVNEERKWMSAIDAKGVRYYHNIVTDQSTYEKPKDFLACSAPTDTTWHTTKVTDRGLNPHDKPLYGTFHKERHGSFKPVVTEHCLNNQNCGLVDLGACHGCDTEQECKDMGISSTVFVTHHRKYMAQQKYNPVSGNYEQAQYHCKREGLNGCKCTCDAHPPCVVKQGYVLRECMEHHSAHSITAPHAHALENDDATLDCNRMLHGNAYPNVPNMQDCCNMCTNHPKCDAWEYSSTKMCVLKSGKPAFKPVPSDSKFAVWSGCRAGETC
jgi:hypothetical protein